MSFREHNPVLIPIDLQMGFQDTAYWGGGRNNPDAEETCGVIIAKWRTLGLDIIHVRHASTEPQSRLHPDHAGFAFHPAAEPATGEEIITKSVNSSFIGTDLKARLDAKGATHLVIIGLTTDHCVSTTTRMAGNYGYQTYLISDATACFDRTGIDGAPLKAELMHQTALASLNGEFATVMDKVALFDML